MIRSYFTNKLHKYGILNHTYSFCQIAVSPLKPTSNTVQKKTGIADKIRIYVKGGTGGQGSSTAGGVGGVGGSVFLKCLKGASLAPYTLRQNRRIVAQHGSHYKLGQFKAKPGKNVYISVPPGTEVRSEQDELLMDLNKHGDLVKIANGGNGGSSKTVNFNGLIGERKNIVLELKTIADVALTGFPNAGKSSLLRVLSRARPKVGNYPFTTLSPMVGSIFYSDSRQITVADLPGLIEDAHMNKGMGHKFLRHVERTKVILLVVDINGFQLKSIYRTPFETVVLLLKELVLYQDSLLSRPIFLVVNKMDCGNSQERYKQLFTEMYSVDQHHSLLKECIYSEEILHNLAVLSKDNFKNVFPISTLSGEGITTLQEQLYHSIPFNEDAISEPMRDFL